MGNGSDVERCSRTTEVNAEIFRCGEENSWKENETWIGEREIERRMLLDYSMFIVEIPLSR